MHKARLLSLERQAARLKRRLQSLRRTSRRDSYGRLSAFMAGLLATGLAFHLAGWQLAAVCLVAGASTFGFFVFVHRRVEASIDQHLIWLALKSAQIARSQRDWPNIPYTFAHQPRPDHPFEADLDVVGRRSLRRLVDTAVSYEGSQRLRDWLTAPVPHRAKALERQRLIRELAPRSLFRERLILSATESAGASSTWDANHLVQWLGRHPSDRALNRWLVILAALAGINAILFVANLQGAVPAWWQITFVIYLGLMLIESRSTAQIWDEALALGDALRQLKAVFQHLERFGYHGAPGLRALCAPFLDRDHRPSRYLARINQVMAAMGVRGNPVLWFALNAVLPWDLFFAHRLNRTKAAMAGHAPEWMNVWFELEALGSLANLAYLNPGYTFPELLGVQGEESASILEARALGHPLIPDHNRVCNDLLVPELGQVTLITGSNMAGKSVFLKTVGANLALSYAGGPVNATYLHTLPFRLFASMAVTDSVTDGISYFYAEVKRLKALLEALDQDHRLPLLYCIDEIFRGTNNRERLVGSRAYVRALADKRGVGFIASHDLALAELAGEVPQMANYHFRDEIAGDRMAFDYVLRPGPCPTTNALRIMALEGLPVPPSEDSPPQLDAGENCGTMLFVRRT